MAWDLTFISEREFEAHVRETIRHYGEKLKPCDKEKFNSNLIDPIKMIFDKAIYGASWEEIITNEIFRQRDKSNTNEIGYFHQRMFAYMPHCHVPENGRDGGWDVIVDVPKGYITEAGNVVHRIYVEMKNKHNTMNSSAAGKTYIKMQNQLLKDDDCCCFLVETIAKCSQNVAWETTVDKQKVGHSRIRRVSMDKFYAIVTGEADAFFKVCLALPGTVQKVLAERDTGIATPHDTVIEEMRADAAKFNNGSEDFAMVMSMYMLGFSTYNGFSALGRMLNNG